MLSLDPFGLLITILFVVACLSIPAINRWLDRREEERRRYQAHYLRRKVGRW